MQGDIEIHAILCQLNDLTVENHSRAESNEDFIKHVGPDEYGTVLEILEHIQTLGSVSASDEEILTAKFHLLASLNDLPAVTKEWFLHCNTFSEDGFRTPQTIGELIDAAITTPVSEATIFTCHNTAARYLALWYPESEKMEE